MSLSRLAIALWVGEIVRRYYSPSFDLGGGIIWFFDSSDASKRSIFAG